MQALQQAAGSDDLTIQLQLLRAVHLDKAQQEAAASPLMWSQACIAAVLPGTVTCLHRLLAGGTGLSQLTLQVSTRTTLQQ